MDNCTFPRYTENDIIVHIRNCLLTGNEAKNFCKNDLFPNVKPEVLHMILMRALQSVYGIRLEHFYMMPVTFETSYPQIFEGFLPIGNLFINMERFFPICRVSDFQIADIINPKAKRTARFLSGILNFLFFRDSRREVYLEIQSTHKSAMEKEQQLQMAIQEATLKLEKLDTIPADQQAEFKELSQDIQELEQKLNQEYRQKTGILQEEIHQKRTEVAEKTQKLNELKLVICNLKEEQKQLKSKITESPEELANCKEHLKQMLHKAKRCKEEVIGKYEVYRDLVEKLPSCQQEVQLYQKKMQTHGANVERLSNILAEIRILEDQVESSKSVFKNAKMEEMTLKRLVTVKTEKLATTEFKIQKIHEDTEQRKQAITEYCNKFQEKRGAVCEKLTATHAEIKQLKGAIQQLNDNVEKEKLKAQEIYFSLRVGLEKYHENLASIVDSYTSAREYKIAELAKLF
ncbi:kinetochore protein Nuf2 [Rhineura floridana]|uniref:kinetochore protein Nuf2 n=1 Tax=Rhineura floridana TaxID=261503 RepID=UPI002AC847F4|nr:kinetochore protein Nuf2 [Rhineura floridana]XP_061440483.1 kinetochore protein Nuf2 [Rhineura floridana]